MKLQYVRSQAKMGKQAESLIKEKCNVNCGDIFYSHRIA